MLMFGQIKNELTCYEIETVYPENLNLKSKDDWEGYAAYC